MKPKIKVLIATHNPLSQIETEIFIPIQVGASINKNIIKESYLKDNLGKHISEKNNTFNELTALYWAWKNLDYDIIGLAHYRRYLDLFHTKPFFKKDKIDVIINSYKDDPKLNLLKDAKKSSSKIIKILTTNDLIIAKPSFCSINGKYCSIAEDYAHNHIASDWDSCMQIILEKYPEYKNSVESYLYNSNRFYICNMFIAKKEWFTTFCEWIFPILFEIEKKITISEDPFQRRVTGFLSERLFTLYVLHNKFKLKELPILFVE
jgi:Domain of unknown function (DUF4422)